MMTGQGGAPLGGHAERNGHPQSAEKALGILYQDGVLTDDP